MLIKVSVPIREANYSGDSPNKIAMEREHMAVRNDTSKESENPRESRRNPEEQTSEAARRASDEAAQAARTAADETAATTRQTTDAAADIAQSNAEAMQKTVESGMAMASDVARRSLDQFARVLGVPSSESEQTVRQAASNTRAIVQCGTVLARGTQDLSRELLDQTRDSLQKNMEGMNRLFSARSPQDAIAIQSGLARDNIEAMVKQGHLIAERILTVTDQAMGKIRM